MPISDFVELMEWDEDDFEFESETVGGWCIEIAGGFPSAGQEFSYKDAQIRILEADERRVLEIELKKARKED